MTVYIMTLKINRSELEKAMREYSDNLISVFNECEGDELKQRVEIAKAKALLSDIDKLNEAAHQLRVRVSMCQRKYYLQQIKAIVK